MMFYPYENPTSGFHPYERVSKDNTRETVIFESKPRTVSTPKRQPKYGYEKPGLTISSIYGYNQDRLEDFLDDFHAEVFANLYPNGITHFEIDFYNQCSENSALRKVLSKYSPIFTKFEDSAYMWKLRNSLVDRNIQTIKNRCNIWGITTSEPHNGIVKFAIK